MMKQSTEYIFKKYSAKYNFVRQVEPQLRAAVEALTKSYRQGGKLLICGNGGSAADADHIVGELMKAFRIRRPLEETLRAALGGPKGTSPLMEHLEGSLPAINLSAQTAFITAQLNDVGGDFIYAQQVVGYGRPEDVLLGISTSGNSRNVLYAGETAKAMGLTTIGLTGRNSGRMGEFFDLLLCAPDDNTEGVQDMHSVFYHILCAALENEFWGE